LTACFPLAKRLIIEIFDHELMHPLGESATHPIERILTRLGAFNCRI
jgi:hypothetical protein